MTGERVPHPDDADATELYDLLVLTAGPWTEARYRTSAPRVVLAKHWMTFVEALSETATADVESAATDLRDNQALLNARNDATRKAIAQRQINRGVKAISKARKQRADVRRALLLED